jgi:hypothetical protein
VVTFDPQALRNHITWVQMTNMYLYWVLLAQFWLFYGYFFLSSFEIY